MENLTWPAPPVTNPGHPVPPLDARNTAPSGRTESADIAGNTVEQTVIHAYRITARSWSSEGYR
ncbi:hypothetical protein [Streptosporangium sp. NPDC000396]|uniref:hypothetical protein n=1 Tax=Streptosporangium sp. NPDC000396 TaxID=3366185 RepID=UPI003674F661